MSKIGTAVVCTPIIVGVPAAAGFALKQEAKTANYAVGKMNEYHAKYPNATDDQQYNVYWRCYQTHAHSSVIGRSLSRTKMEKLVRLII